MRTIASPDSRRSRSRRRMIPAWTVTSSAVVGSSATSSFGRQASATAIAIRWRIPPENWCGNACSAPSGSGIRTSRSSSSARAAAASLRPSPRWQAHVLGELRSDRTASGAGTSSGPGRPSRARGRRSAAARAADSRSRSAPVEDGAALDRRARRQQPHQREHRHRLPAAALARRCRRPRPARRGSRSRRRPSRGRRRSAAGRGGPRPRAAALTSAPVDSRAVRGSKTSRRLSPMKLNASTAVKIASPGNVPIHQNWKYWVPVATIEPHSASGGWAPRPRNDSPESRRIALPTSSVASTSTGPTTFGSTSRTSARRAERAEQPRRPDVLRLADREDEAAHDARVRRPGDDHEREDGVRKPAPERGRHDHREDDRREGEDEIGGAHHGPVRPSRGSSRRPHRGRPPIVEASTTRRSPSGSEMRAP